MIEKIRDDLYVKKGWDGYRVVYPIKKDLDRPFSFKDNINWKNFLGQWHFWLKSLLFLIALYFFVQMYLADTEQCREFVDNFGYQCGLYYEQNLKLNQSYQRQLDNLKDLSNLNLTFVVDDEGTGI